MKGTRISYFIVIAFALLTSCNNLKHIPANDALYTGATVKVDSTDMSAKQRRALESELKGLVRPRPNKKFLGMRIKLSLYYLAGNPKKENSLRGTIKYKWGEPPVLLSQFNLEYNTKILQNTLENRGYFNAIVEGDTTIKGKKASSQFAAHIGPRYYINQVTFDSTADVLHQKINETAAASLLKPNEPFDLAVVKSERIRIDADLKEKGFYFFDPGYILVQVDSSIGNNRVNLYVRVKSDVGDIARVPYTINDIYIFPSYRLNASNAISSDTTKNGMVFYKGYYLKDRQKLYKPKLFEDAIQFSTGDIYNRTDHNATLSRLINLNVFRFVKNRLEIDPTSDSAKLNSYYYLTPQARQSLRGEINATTKSNGLTGSNITLGWKKRNAFRGGEILGVDATGGFEVQFGGQFKGYNTFRTGLEVNVSFPRFLVPFKLHTKRGGYVPRTNASVGVDLYIKQKLYTLTSFTAALGYVWKTGVRDEFKISPFVFNYVVPTGISDEYRDSVIKNPTLQTTIDTQFTFGPILSYTFNGIQDNIFRNGSFLKADLDLSGNIVGLIQGANYSTKPKELLGARYSQYVKAEVDFRRYLKISDKMVWVNRIDIGASAPYGNSKALPYIKQFFSGGSNSLRAFRSRTVGPGSYDYPETASFRPDQGGDLKLELNTELRAKLAGIVHGALFIDAGNIWLVNEDPRKPGAKFSSDFLKELYIGAGVGLRFDISFLVLRLDLATPVRRADRPLSERWVLKDFDFGSAAWRKQNLIFNLGIGYPF